MGRPVLTKADFVRRYAAGEFGNASPTWNDLSEWGQSGYDGPVHIRNRIAGAETWYNLKWPEVDYWWHLASTLYGSSSLYISAMAPTELTLIQGEVQRGLWGLDLYYTTIRKPMRDALREQARQVSGVTSLYLLQRFMCPRSYLWMEYLLEEYPGHVIEFSTYDCDWGTVPGFNTVFWEVRCY